MRDIILKPAHPRPSQSAPTKPSQSQELPLTPEKKRLVLIVEKAIEVLSQSGSWAYQQLHLGEEVIVLEPPTLAVGETQKSERRKRRLPHIGVERRHKLKEAARTKAHATKKALKTPIGKLAIVQVAAMVGLFSYVSFNNRTEANPNKNSTTNSDIASTQKYLPSIPQYIPPKAFDEDEAKKENTQLALYSWVTPWNLEAASKHPTLYASLSAFWGTVDTDGIHISPKGSWQSWEQFAAAAKQPNQDHYLTVSGDPDYTYLALSNPDTQSKHIAELLRIVQEEKFDGIDIDYEALGSDNRDIFTSFIRNLTTAFHANNKKVAVTVEARINNQVPMDWHNLGVIADEVRMMVYDYHSSSTGTPGPVAPLGWLKDVLEYATGLVPNNKLVVGLGNYGYNWTRVQDGDTISWKGGGVSFDEAMALASSYKVEVDRAKGIDSRGYDQGSIPNFNYTDESGAEHSLWFEDKTSLDLKLNLISEYQTKGVIFWSVGLGDQAFWDTHMQNNQ